MSLAVPRRSQQRRSPAVFRILRVAHVRQYRVELILKRNRHEISVGIAG